MCCFIKKEMADEMRQCDWSSDVCSSDLVEADGQEERKPQRQRGHRNSENRRLFKRIDIARILKDAAVILKPDEGRLEPERVLPLERRFDRLKEIGRASCRERVCQYV